MGIQDFRMTRKETREARSQIWHDGLAIRRAPGTSDDPIPMLQELEYQDLFNIGQVCP